jgi:dTDP-4-amino-4,6-dideoxygalactose transaminase
MNGHGVSRLAVFGGPPAFAQPLHVGRPNLPDRDRMHEALDNIFDRRWLTNNGPAVQEFEVALERHLGVKHCVAVCNATVGLQVAARALALSGEVIVPSFTFIATAHALRWLGLEPVFCDVDPLTHNLDPLQVERLITSHTSAILGVHVWGRACDIAALEVIARAADVHLLFDAAHAFSCSDRDVMIGNFGELEVFSFHATKFMNTFEGGAIATNSDELADRLRLMVNFGFAGYDNVVELGTNGKMPEISAAMGLASLAQIDEIVHVNRRHHEAYRSALRDIDGLDVVTYSNDSRHNFQYVVLDVDAGNSRLNRDELLEVLWADGVRARRYFFPGCHRMAPYCTERRWRDAELPHSDRLSSRLLTLPTGTAVTLDDIERVTGIIREAAKNVDAVRGALRGGRAAV